MNKSACENCTPECIVVSLEKNPKEVDFFKNQITRINPFDFVENQL